MLKLRDKLRGGIEPKKFTHILSMLLWETIIGIDQTKFKLFAPKSIKFCWVWKIYLIQRIKQQIV